MTARCAEDTFGIQAPEFPCHSIFLLSPNPAETTPFTLNSCSRESRIYFDNPDRDANIGLQPFPSETTQEPAKIPKAEIYEPIIMQNTETGEVLKRPKKME